MTERALKAIDMAADIATLKPSEVRCQAFILCLSGALELLGETQPEALPVAVKVKALLEVQS